MTKKYHRCHKCNTKPDYRIWYCKSNKQFGDPIIVEDLKTGVTKSTNEIIMKNVDIVMKFNNAVTKAKRSGATTVLEVYTKNTSRLDNITYELLDKYCGKKFFNELAKD